MTWRKIGYFSVFVAVLFWGSCKQKQVAPEGTHVSPPLTQVATGAGSPKLRQEFRQKLQISEREVKENKLLHFSEDWYGVPYRYGGCDKNGIDCSCFANVLYQTVYTKVLARSATEMFKACENLQLNEMQQGDLVFFKIGTTSISHVGVILKNRLFIHASTSKGVIINSLDEAYYKKYFYCSGKVKHT